MRKFIETLLLVVMAGGAGYALRGLEGRLAHGRGAAGLPSLDYFVTAQSFSEVENVRALCEGLARRYLAEVQVDQVQALQRLMAEGRNVPEAVGTRYGGAIRKLEAGIAEFAGTGQELVLTQELLWLLLREKQYGRWLDVYLDIVYAHPTHALTSSFAREALTAGRLTGRSAEVSDALRFVESIPRAFEGKHGIRAAREQLASLEP